MSENGVLRIISHDLELHGKFTSTGFFDEVSNDTDIGVIERGDILIVSDRQVSYNRFIEFCSVKRNNFGKVFYMVSEDSKVNYKNIRSILKSKDVEVIPPKYTVNQIIERVCIKAGKNVNTDKNIGVFVGADGKVGLTSVVQGIGECMAQHTKSNILVLHLNGNHGFHFVNSEENTQGIDDIKAKVINNILQVNELVSACYHKDNLYILKGPEQIIGTRHYHPKHIETLVHLASQNFAAVLIDAGSRLASGLAIGAMNSTNKRYLVTTQQDNVKREYDATAQQLFSRFGFDTEEFNLILNKHITAAETYSPSQLADLYNVTLLGTIPYVDYGWQAERDRVSLYSYDNPGYQNSISEISAAIASQLGLDFIQTEAKKQSFFKKVLGRV